jgi:hypothetical protein
MIAIRAVAGAFAAAMPDLLLWRNEAGLWLWKRTGKTGWIGSFATQTAACADAERCGMPKPYRPVVVTVRE